nr:ATP-binding cassette domain-containing protein [Haladaptatus sp. W1]
MVDDNDVLIDLQAVRKEYDEVTAVESIDFTIRRGEFFSLVGPSGCGKTTTLRMISGFETPTQGRVSLNGEDMTGVPPTLGTPTSSSSTSRCSPT